MKDLFGNDAMPPKPGKGPGQRIAVQLHKQMLLVFGVSNSQRCRGCAHFQYKILAKKYPKCVLSGPVKGASTDWNGKWQACGKFENTQKTT
jgi:hypothetical protein